MLRDYLIDRPRGLDIYGLHQFVAALTDGHERPLFADDETTLVVRTTADIGEGSALPEARNGELHLFDLAATVARKQGGKTLYWPSKSRQPREEWLKREAAKNGFEVVAVHITARKEVVNKADRSYALDKTKFIGVLRVTDEKLLANAIQNGIGRVGKAFGSGLLSLQPLNN